MTDMEAFFTRGIRRAGVGRTAPCGAKHSGKARQWSHGSVDGPPGEEGHKV